MRVLPAPPSYHALRMTGKQHALLRQHLFPGDGREAVALALCGRLLPPSGEIDSHRIAETAVAMIHRLDPIPYDQCSERSADRVTWSTDRIPRLLAEAARRDLVLLKIHSHPGGLQRFSGIDDRADRELFASVGSWLDRDDAHLSAVMLPDGSVFARSVTPGGGFTPVCAVMVTGVDIRLWRYSDAVERVHAPARERPLAPTSRDASHLDGPEFTRRTAQAFGRRTTELMSRISAAVIGCSGTGSPVVEMLARLGIGRLLLIDPDYIEEKNMNRILNATMADVRAKASKVHVLARAVGAMELGTVVEAIPSSLFSPEIVRRVARCDIVFGCMDSADGRDLLNRLAAFYCLPYFDVGVRLIADGSGGIDQICGTVHYLQPDGSSLLSRGVYSPAALQAAALRRESPQRYASLLEEKYISGVNENRPAVVSVNMLYASLAVNELLARLHPYRDDGNAGFAGYGLSLTQARLIVDDDGAPCEALARHAGRGDTVPLLNMPELSPAATPPGSGAVE